MMITRTKKSERGNALLEFALGFAVLWALFSGLYQFGYSFYVYNALMTSVANAAQLAAKMNYDTGTPSTYTDAVTNMVIYGTTTPANGANPIVPSLSSSNVNLNLNLQSSVPTNITVSIKSFKVDCLFTSFTFDGKPRATTVYMGTITCAGC
jgi:Flp pilus assembly protein TadG